MVKFIKTRKTRTIAGRRVKVADVKKDIARTGNLELNKEKLRHRTALDRENKRHFNKLEVIKNKVVRLVKKFKV